ncbi:MAG TPA: cysteine--tRNA ligase [Candidatus Woesebacteria bacterium]|nr:cysteine--tRNA ligase [Candidatus Woesebacteria bacterium]HPR99582.1 cysteine--tRNA ligase [Candidatus Woesebacteria bacterium]
MDQKIYLYNTLTRKKEEFKPIQEGKVNFFVCGPTVYDYPHLGHAKTYTQFDFIVKYLRYRGYDVTYVQNITDIDDKIISRSKEKGIVWDKLAREFEAIYIEDMKALSNNSVTKYARATDYIKEIIKQVKVLMEKGFAYQISDGIYYEVAKFANYGKLSGRTESQAEDSVSRIDENKEKRGWNDFCLWKMSKEGEPFWETELGKGRPGWHIEDTAITETLFGPQYDIHGGAVDLIFPHHEAEISQIEAASGKSPMVRYWLHTGFLNIDSEKMSKSKGNFKTIREALKQYNFRVLRFLFLGSHYRSAMDFTDTILEQTKNSLKRIQDFIDKIDVSIDNLEEKRVVNELREKINLALGNDFDTPTAFADLFEFIRSQNTKGISGKYAYNYFVELNQFLDVFEFKKEEIPQEIRDLVKKRVKAKLNKDWAEADRLREEIKKEGYLVEDTKDDCKIKRIMLS